jgi:hypothetical protein
MKIRIKRKSILIFTHLTCKISEHKILNSKKMYPRLGKKEALC